VFVRDVLPDFCKKLKTILRKTEFAAQVIDLRIYGRCACGSRCGTFYCIPLDEYAKLAPFSDGVLDPVTVAKGRIIRVDTLADPEVDAVPRELFPDSKNAAWEWRAQQPR
jgi:hypothetical protein